MRDYQGTWRQRHPLLMLLVEGAMLVGTVLVISAPDLGGAIVRFFH